MINYFFLKKIMVVGLPGIDFLQKKEVNATI